MLPGQYGMDILKGLRAFSEVPVLILSARNDSFDKVRALKLGADDYLTKPFWPEELVERVRARLRRPTMQREGALEGGPVRIDPEHRTVKAGGKSVELTASSSTSYITLRNTDYYSNNYIPVLIHVISMPL